NYHDTFVQFPAAGTFDELGQPMHSWVTSLLPLMDQASLSRRIRYDLPWTAPENETAFQVRIESLLLPGSGQPRTREGYAISNYAANVHVLGANRGLGLCEITDGSSNTIAAGEVIANPRAWGDPRNARDPSLGINASQSGFGGPYTGGCHMLMADGAVKFLSNNTAPALLEKLTTPRGGESVPIEY
ncbi:MAG TPA: DUF1559 domain-containing protein, partial [Planctomycetaceae bacterium]|nr:DUF1559 domain-containing protein [Planctomycetaceae bacterium]